MRPDVEQQRRDDVVGEGPGEVARRRGQLDQVAYEADLDLAGAAPLREQVALDQPEVPEHRGGPERRVPRERISPPGVKIRTA